MYRQIRVVGDANADTVAVMLFDKPGPLPACYAGLDRRAGGALKAAMRRAEFSAARGALQCLYPPSGPKRLYVLGLGDRGQSGDCSAMRIAGAKLVKAAYDADVSRLSIDAAGLDGAATPDDAGRAIADGLAIANFEFDLFKGKGDHNKPDRANKGKTTRLAVSIDRSMRKGLTHGLHVGESVTLARKLAATPPNVANPRYLVAFCRKIARQVGLKCTIIDAKRAAALKMGGLIAVGAAGSTPPAMICLEWPGRGRAPKANGKPILLVGKAVTFDTGGYSIKPAASMDTMKYDKCGGVAVIGAMHAIARLKLPARVVALVPVAENMIDKTGYRPSDILRMYNGVTVEVTNTDAEGRLVLADALAYGCRHYKPGAIIDLATLTGGVVVALGSLCAGAFCGDATLRGHLFDAAEHTGERLWHLPLWAEHKELLKSNHADIVNSGGREAHPIQGAAFLRHFVDQKTPWAHLDIAGVSDLKNANDLFCKGPTGFGVRLLARAVETWR